MDFRELARARYSCRAYRDDAVEEEKLTAVLQAAKQAPTACNRQPFRLYVLPTADRREAVHRLYGREWLEQAPLLIGIAGEPGRAWVRRDGHNYVDVDCAIVMDHLILQAADLGLGTCWIAAFDVAAARELLELPTGWEPIAFTPLGYPRDTRREKSRRPLDELVVRR